MNEQQIKEKIDSFPRWHYQFDLGGHKTPIFNERLVRRHVRRKRHFFDPLVRLCGGSLEGKRVLDLGCNAGFWSLRAMGAGADYVLGIDGRQMHVDQANFVFDVKGISKERYDFVPGNVFGFDYERHGPFDVVLCLGLLYHVSKPMELMETISRVNTDLLVMDTTLSTAEGSLFEVRKDRLDEPRDAVDYEFVLVPTKEAVIDLVEQFGYSVVTLEPDFRNRRGELDFRGVRDYELGARRAYLCARETDLSRLDVETEPPRAEADRGA